MSDRLFTKLTQPSSVIALYGIAPPKATTDAGQRADIAARQETRIRALGPDGVIIYDIQDEADRTADVRPFPFAATVDPDEYAYQHLRQLDIPKIVYRCVRRMTGEALAAWSNQPDFVAPGQRYSVLVGGSSGRSRGAGIDLADAYPIVRRHAPALIVGGIAIAERHHRKGDEHLRLAQKIQQGCRFFVTQAIYDVTSSKSLLSDYARLMETTETHPVPIIFTFAPCGSVKTMEFMKWLGISFPRWLENELRDAPDVLERSIDLCERIFAELFEFAREKRIPIGINVESVSIRKVEVDASFALFRSLRARADGRRRSSPLPITVYDRDRMTLLPLFRAADDSESEIAKYLASGVVVVAAEGGEAVGHAQVIPTETADTWELKSLAVAEAHRGAGLGPRLVEAAIAFARSRGAARVLVATGAADTRVLRFYLRLGFRLLRIERDVFTPAAGYPADLSVDGIPLVDRAWLDLQIT